MLTRSSSSSISGASSSTQGEMSRSRSLSNVDESDKRRRSTVTNDDDDDETLPASATTFTEAKPLKKRWLAHHHVDQEQQLNLQETLPSLIDRLREYNFQDWLSIPVLVQRRLSSSIEYLPGTIGEIRPNGHFLVNPSVTTTTSDSSSPTMEIHLFENLFGILSDNAPAIRELTEGKHVLFRQEKCASLYQSGVIVQRTSDTKFQILPDDQQEMLALPRQSIRLFLPPWHDELPVDWNKALLQANLFNLQSPSPRESSISSPDSFQSLPNQSNSSKETTSTSSKDVPTTIYNQVVYHKGDVMTSSQSQIRKKFNGKQWRRLCSKDGCPRESQRRGLCSRHLSQKGRQEHRSNAQTTLSFDRIHSQPSILPLHTNATTTTTPTPATTMTHGYYSAPQSRTTTPLLISPRFLLQANRDGSGQLEFDNEDYQHSNGYSSLGPRSTNSDLQLNDLSQVNPIRTVNWPELLPKISLNLDSTAFHSIATGEILLLSLVSQDFVSLDESKDDETNGHSNPPSGNSFDEENSVDPNESSSSSCLDDQHSKEKHVRRPMNSFMLFSQEQRAKIHLANPNRDNRNVSKILGEKWYSLSPHEQEQYKIRAKQLRHEHFKQNPLFKWTNPLSKPTTTTTTTMVARLSPTTKNKDEQEQCRRSARLQSQSNQEKNLSPLCDRLQAFAQVCSCLRR